MTFAELMALDSKGASSVPSPAAPSSPKATAPAPNPAPAHGGKPPRKPATTGSWSHDTKSSCGHDTTTSCHHEATTARQEARSESGLVSRLREAVKPLGKEGATHRFTPEEKSRLAEIVYQYHQRGLKTSENEIVRVAVNWLLQDHAASGEQGMLRRVLRALHE